MATLVSKIYGIKGERYLSVSHTSYQAAITSSILIQLMGLEFRDMTGKDEKTKSKSNIARVILDVFSGFS